jgi:hypothetical protein
LFGEEERKKNKNKVFICALFVFFAERDAGSEEDSTTLTYNNNNNRGCPQSSNKKLLSLEIEAKEGMRESAADERTNFQTEEWVRVSDFDVGTPTSITQEPQEEDYDAVAAATGDQEDDSSSSSFGDFLQGLDRFADWETISSRDALGGPSSSLSDDWKKLLLVDQQGAVDESIIAGSSSPERTFTLPYEVADERSRSEDVPAEQQKPDPESSTQPQESSEDSISTCSEEEAHNPSTQQQEQDEDDDRSSSIVEITSSQAEQDEEEEEHGSLVEVPYPEEEGDEEDKVSSIVEVSSRPELDDDNYSSGIGDLVSLEDEENDDDQDGSVVVVVASIADPEDEDDRTFSCPESSISEEPNDDDNDDHDDDEAHHHHLSLPPLTASVLEKLSIENHQAVAMISVAEEIIGSEAEQFTSSQLLQEAQGNDNAEEPEETAPPLEQEETTHVPDELLDDTADSDKDLLHQRKQQEEEIFAEEEENIGKLIAESLVEEPPLMMSAVLETVVTKEEMMLSEPLKCGEVEDLQPVAIEETGCKPFEEEDNMPDSQNHAPPLHDDDDGAEMRNREKSGAEEEEGQAAEQNWNDAAAVEDDGEQQESAAMTEETLPIDPGAKPEVSVVVVVVGNTQPDALLAAKDKEEVHSIMSSLSANDAAESIVMPTEKEDNQVKARNLPSRDLPRNSLAEEEPNGCTAIASFFGKGFSMSGPGGPPIYLLQFISLQKSTEVSNFVHSVYSLLLAMHFYNETYSWTTIITAKTTFAERCMEIASVECAAWRLVQENAACRSLQ